MIVRRAAAVIVVTVLAVLVYAGWGHDGGKVDSLQVSLLLWPQSEQQQEVLSLWKGGLLSEAGGRLDVTSSFRRVLGGAPDARRYGAAARRFAAQVAEASGGQSIGAAGGSNRGEGVGEGHTMLGVQSTERIPSPLLLQVRSPAVEASVDACPAAAFKLQALEAYGVEWAYDKLRRVERCESTCITLPCVIGDALERGPLQFHPDTWEQQDGEGEHWNPYWQEDACNPETAWKAAGAFIAAGRQGEWSCWWLTE